MNCMHYDYIASYITGESSGGGTARLVINRV